MRWLGPERRWAAVVLAAVLPPSPCGRFPGVAQVDLDAFWARFGAAAPPSLRLTVHAAVWLVMLAPLWLLPGFKTLGRCSAAQQDGVVARLAGANTYAVRQCMEVLKLCACMAAFHHPAIRAPFGVSHAANA